MVDETEGLAKRVAGIAGTLVVAAIVALVGTVYTLRDDARSNTQRIGAIEGQLTSRLSADRILSAHDRIHIDRELERIDARLRKLEESVSVCRQNVVELSTQFMFLTRDEK